MRVKISKISSQYPSCTYIHSQWIHWICMCFPRSPSLSHLLLFSIRLSRKFSFSFIFNFPLSHSVSQSFSQCALTICKHVMQCKYLSPSQSSLFTWDNCFSFESYKNKCCIYMCVMIWTLSKHVCDLSTNEILMMNFLWNYVQNLCKRNLKKLSFLAPTLCLSVCACKHKTEEEMQCIAK